MTDQFAEAVYAAGISTLPVKSLFLEKKKIETKYNFFFFFTFKEWEKYKSHVSELASDENKRRRPTVTRSVARLGKPHKNRRERATKAVSDVF